jgi:uncharacterized DUF497 family protein
MGSAMFEWDPHKAALNLESHGVSFSEASTVFADYLSVTIGDPIHSAEEQRFVILGISALRRLVVVVHTMRGERIRIISARLAEPNEKRKYQEGLF